MIDNKGKKSATKIEMLTCVGCSPQYFGPDTRPGPEVWRQLVTIEKNARFANTVGQVRLITLINCRKGCKSLILGYSTSAVKTQK